MITYEVGLPDRINPANPSDLLSDLKNCLHIVLSTEAILYKFWCYS